VSPEIEAWLRQAQADLTAGASTAKETSPCHRRYWLQQACEKGIKALGRLLWASRNDPVAQKAFEKHFLWEHSPWLELDAYVKAPTAPTAPAAPRAITVLHRQIDAELRKIDRKGVLRKVDATKPTKKPDDMSYRYPFLDAGIHRAPCELRATRWDAYQGNRRTVIGAVRRLLECVANRAKLHAPP
jgi:hypothetical protein